MDNHTYPDYKRSLERVANVLEALAAGEMRLVESQLETQAYMQQLAASQERLQVESEAARREHAEYMREQAERAREHRERMAATDDKLNGLIDYFRRHLEDHSEGCA